MHVDRRSLCTEQLLLYYSLAHHFCFPVRCRDKLNQPQALSSCRREPSWSSRIFRRSIRPPPKLGIAYPCDWPGRWLSMAQPCSLKEKCCTAPSRRCTKRSRGVRTVRG